MPHGTPATDDGIDAPPTGAERKPGSMTFVLVDASALLTFVAVGLRSHRIGAVAEVAARNAIPLAAMWTVTSMVVGTYRRRDLASLAVTWVVAVPVALLARTWWVGSPSGDRIVVFVAVGLAFTALFLLIGRGLLGVAVRRAVSSGRRGSEAGAPDRGSPRSLDTG